MERLTKRYNERTGTYEYIDSFSGAGIFDTIVKGITSKFAKDTAKTIATKALEAGVSKFGSEIGTRAADKVISTVDKRFSKKTKLKDSPKVNINIEVDSDDESSKPLENVIMKELNKKSPNKITSLENSNALKKQYYGYGDVLSLRSSRHIPSGGSNKQFKNKLNKLLK